MKTIYSSLALCLTLFSLKSAAQPFVEIACPPEDRREAAAMHQIRLSHELIDGAVVKSRDNKCIMMSAKLLKQSETMKGVIHDHGVNGVIPLPNTDYETLKHVAGILVKISGQKNQDQVSKIKDILRPMNMADIVRIVNAANYLDIQLEHPPTTIALAIGTHLPRQKSVLDVGMTFIHERIFINDVDKIGTMTDQEYADYKVRNLDPLSTLDNDIRKQLISDALLPVESHFKTSVTPNQINFGIAQIMRYVQKNSVPAVAQLPGGLKSVWNKAENVAVRDNFFFSPCRIFFAIRVSASRPGDFPALARNLLNHSRLEAFGIDPDKALGVALNEWLMLHKDKLLAMLPNATQREINSIAVYSFTISPGGFDPNDTNSESDPTLLAKTCKEFRDSSGRDLSHATIHATNAYIEVTLHK